MNSFIFLLYNSEIKASAILDKESPVLSDEWLLLEIWKIKDIYIFLKSYSRVTSLFTVLSLKGVETRNKDILKSRGSVFLSDGTWSLLQVSSFEGTLVMAVASCINAITSKNSISLIFKPCECFWSTGEEVTHPDTHGTAIIGNKMAPTWLFSWSVQNLLALLFSATPRGAWG